MTELESPSDEYIKGFNQGYILEKEAPDLSEKISTVFENRNDDEARGFLAGRNEYQKEKAKNKLPSWLKEDRLTSLEAEPKTKGKDDLEPEKG